MRERRRATIGDLRLAIECLPRATRVAMLDGMQRNEIIVGAYTDSGGICPMLAAHRAGGRTDCISFARAWDRFAFRTDKRRQARRATPRELLILRTLLEASLLEDDGPAPDLAAVVAEHKALVAQAQRRRATARPSDPSLVPEAQRQRAGSRPGDPDRSRELRSRPGWAWTRIVRRYDDYERALALLEREAPRELVLAHLEHEAPRHPVSA